MILSVSLINSIAAISVSDGSAFVTKAEFAADLNNLSNRMSSLENSLDAKIDSLVSSYLSRNGIWNGEKQEVDSKFLNEAGSLSNICWVKKYNDKATSKDYLVFFSHTDKLSAVIQIISKTSKAGLCILNFTAWPFCIPLGKESDINSSNNGFSQSPDANTYGYAYSNNGAARYGWEGNVTYGIYRGKSTDTATSINPNYSSCVAHISQKISIGYSLIQGSAYLADTYAIAQKNQTSVSFFLEKDEKLFICFYLYGGGGRFSTSAWVSMAWQSSLGSSVVPKGPAFNVGNVVVY